MRDDDASLDIVQDAMIKLAEKYGDRPAGPSFRCCFSVFCRMRCTTISVVRKGPQYVGEPRFRRSGNADDDEFDPLETFEAQQGSAGAESNEHKLEREQVLQMIDDEIQKLPARQREAFLMRYWEDMDVAETAAAMGCSEGSAEDALLAGHPHAGASAQGQRNHAMSSLETKNSSSPAGCAARSTKTRPAFRPPPSTGWPPPAVPRLPARSRNRRRAGVRPVVCGRAVRSAG